MNVLDLVQKRSAMRKIASTNGGEWQGPCPGCGGEDRFRVWPEENGGAGSWWCRGCGKGGDAIQYLREFEGLGYREACRRLGVEAREHTGKEWQRLGQKRQEPDKQGFTPPRYPDPPPAWMERAESLVAWAQERLRATDEGRSIQEWLDRRGIDAAAAAATRLGYNPGENGKDLYRARKAWGLEEVIREDGRPRALWIPRGLIIPCLREGRVVRVRIRRFEEYPPDPRYYVLPGSSMATMAIHPERRAHLVVESELDAVACARAQDLAGAVALGSVSARPDAEASEILAHAIQILNALDYDAAGAKAMAWWETTFPRSARWPAPAGKDPGEACLMGKGLKEWIEVGLAPAILAGREVGKAPAERTGKDLPASPARPDMRDHPDIPDGLWRLHDILRRNPAVSICNTEARFAIERRGGAPVGRNSEIHDLVYRHAEVLEYLLKHPAERIDGNNLIV